MLDSLEEQFKKAAITSQSWETFRQSTPSAQESTYKFLVNLAQEQAAQIKTLATVALEAQKAALIATARATGKTDSEILAMLEESER